MEPNEMRKHRAPLDDQTVERLLDLRMDPEDAPPGYAEAARLLQRAAADPGPAAVDHGLVSSMAQAISSSPPSPSPRESTVSAKRITAKVATTAAVVLFSTAGAAAAATGNLPDPAQDAVASAASHVGFELPRSTEVSHRDDHPTADDHADETDGETTVTTTAGGTDRPGREDHTTGNVDNSTDADQHGVDVSGTARSTETEGRDHGAAVSEVARDGHGGGTTTSTTEPGDDDGPETESHGRSADHSGSGSSHAEDNPSSGRRG